MHFSGCSVLPAKSEHAVQAVVFVCELAAAISPEAVLRVIEHYDKSSGLREAFPRKAELRGVAISITAGTGVGVQNRGDVVGVVFDRIAPDGNVEIAISIQGNTLSFTCNTYSRWSQVSQQAIKLLSEFACFVLPDPGVAVLGLQYVDEFYVTGKVQAFRPSMLFAPDGALIPPFFHEKEGPWHNHLGWFEPIGNEGARMLNNVNISVVAQPERMVVQIVGAHRLIRAMPISSIDELAKTIEIEFDVLHRRNKDLLGELLVDKAKSSIHLDS